MPTRLMVALHYLKCAFNLSDEQVLAEWLENPYWQYLSGMKFFQHRLPIDSSSMTRWRRRIKEAGAQRLLQETIETGLRLNLVKGSQLKRVNHALHITAMVRLRCHPESRAYVARKIAEGKTQRAAIPANSRASSPGASTAFSTSQTHQTQSRNRSPLDIPGSTGCTTPDLMY